MAFVTGAGITVTTLPAAARACADEPKRAEKDNEKLKKLLRERLDAAQKLYEAIPPGTLYTGAGPDRGPISEPGRRLLTAELDVAQKHEERVAACDKNLERADAWKKLADAQRDKGQIDEADLQQWNCCRLEAEILLEREKARQEEPKPSARDDEKLNKLLGDRLKAARIVYDEREKQYSSGKTTLDLLREAGQLLVTAQLDASEKKEDRVAACKQNVERLTRFKGIADARLKAGPIQFREVSQWEYYRLDAEILLERERAGGQGPKPPTVDDGQLKKLLEARVEAAQKVFDGELMAFQASKSTSAGLYKAGRQLLTAQLDFMEKQEDRVAACEQNLERAAARKKMADEQHEKGFIGDEELLRAQCDRLEAEILLEREKVKKE
jgi:hypothetical protein